MTTSFHPETMKLYTVISWQARKRCHREFVYRSGGIEREGYAHILPELVDEVVAYHGKLGLGEFFRFRVKNISEGLAIGGYALIAGLQRYWNRKHIRPRSFMGRDKNCCWSFSTRVLRL
jgi:hypothetical protein